MVTLVIDTEPKWIAHQQEQGAIIARSIDEAMPLLLDADKGIEQIIVSSRQLSSVAGLVEIARGIGVGVIVVTGQPTTREAIEAYRAGAVDYRAKDFR